MSFLVHELGYVALGTPDVAGAAAFLVDICQLEVSQEQGDSVFLRGDDRHHWIRLEPREHPGVVRVGYQATSLDALSEVARRLDARGIEHWPGGTIAADRVSNTMRFRDLNGIEFELYEEMVRIPAPRRPTGIELAMLLHAVFFVDDVVAARDFWRDVLGFRRSDQIEEFGVFLRAGNRYHHAVGFMRGSAAPGTLHHVCIQARDIDDVVRMRNIALQASVPMEHELVRHAASGSIGTYIEAALLGIGIEYCVGHGQVDDDDPGRLLVASPSTVNVWNAIPPTPPKRADR